MVTGQKIRAYEEKQKVESKPRKSQTQEHKRSSKP